MALVQCPNCGKEISDKSKKCIHCGYIIIEDPKPICPECGAEIEKGATVCDKCGYPLEVKSIARMEPQQVEVTKVSIINDRLSKRKIVVILIAGLIGIGVIFGISNFIRQKQIEAYGEKLELISTTMLEGAADAENCGNLIKSVWSNSIFEDKDSTTDKYTRANNGTGYFYDDFNIALANLFDDKEFQEKIDEIENNQQVVTDLMKEMQNPPEKWEKAYEDLQDYYDAYLTLTNLAISPAGSLQSFSSNFSDADMEVVNCYNKMEFYWE